MSTEASLKETVVGMLLTIALAAMFFFGGYEIGSMIERQKLEMKASDEAHQTFDYDWRAGANWAKHMIEKDGDE